MAVETRMLKTIHGLRESSACSITKLKNILEKKNIESKQEMDEKLALSALLIEVAMIDGTISNSEKTTILRLISAFFELNNDESKELYELASEIQENQSQILGYTRVVKEKYSENERINLIEMLWEVVQADGIEDSFETNLIRRIAGLLYVKDFESGLARKRAQKKSIN